MPPPRITTLVPLPEAAGCVDGGCGRRHDGQKAKGLHHGEGGAIAAGLANSHEKIAST